MRSVDVRYAGQGYELAVDWSDKFVEAFHWEHERRYGYSDVKRPVEVVNVRVREVVISEKIREERHELREGDGSAALVKRERLSIYAGGRVCWRPGGDRRI